MTCRTSSWTGAAPRDRAVCDGKLLKMHEDDVLSN